METADVVIAGAGIIGLSLALELASSGMRVTVLERGRAMEESSWAAAGMLAGRDPENPPEMAALSELSLNLYPDYLAKIEELSDCKVPFRTTETVQTGRSLGDMILLDEWSIDPRDLCKALPLAAGAAGVNLVEHASITGVSAGDRRVTIQTASQRITAGSFVNCAGAWAATHALQPVLPESRNSTAAPDLESLIFPYKGQIAAFRLSDSAVNGVTRTPDFYLVPRGDGRIVVGATVERAGFDKTVDRRAIDALFQAAAKVIPEIATAEVLEIWSGLRPGTPDRLPLLGQMGHRRCWIATGHFRNGIMLAPGTARVMSQSIRGEALDADISCFAPGRFAPAHLASGLAGDNPLTAAL